MKKNILTICLLGGAFLFPALCAIAQERDVYFNPSALNGNVNWGNVAWLDSFGVTTAAPDADSNVFLEGPRASNYRHVVVPAGDDVTINSLTLSNSNWGANTYRTLELIGTVDNRVKFTVTNGITIAERHNSIYGSYTDFTSGAIGLQYFGRIDFTASTFTSGEISGAGAVNTIFAFDSTVANVGGVSVTSGGLTSVVNGSALTIKTGNYYASGAHTVTVENSSFTVEQNFILGNTGTLNFTGAVADFNYGIRSSNGTLTLGAKDSTIIVRDSTYTGSTSTAIAVADGQVAKINLVNSTIVTDLSDSIDIRNTGSEINISMMDEGDVAISTGVLNFTGVLTVDFAGMLLTEDKYFTLISATNAGDLFAALDTDGNIIVTGLATGESYAWDVSAGSIGIHFYAIPEPGAYAAIFGAIALVLVAYRRRK